MRAGVGNCALIVAVGHSPAEIAADDTAAGRAAGGGHAPGVDAAGHGAVAVSGDPAVVMHEAAAGAGHVDRAHTVFNRSARVIADDAGQIPARGSDAALNDAVPNRAAAQIAEQALIRSGRVDVQPADDMPAAVKTAPEGRTRRADRRPRAALPAERNVRRQQDGFPIEAVAAVDRVGERLERRIAADGQIRVGR